MNSTAGTGVRNRSTLITGLEPTSAEQGTTLTVVLTGDVTAYATHFAAGTSVADFGAGITVKALSVTGQNVATAVIAIDPSAAEGPRSVFIITGEETAISVNAFNVLKGKSSITGRLVDPVTGQPIAGATVVIQGTNLTALTDVNGNFTVEGVPTGQQNLLVNAVNREFMTVSLAIKPNSTLTVQDIKPALTVFDPAASPSVSLGSVVGRGITGLVQRADKDGIQKLLADAVLLIEAAANSGY